jgi:hypothetical protein
LWPPYAANARGIPEQRIGHAGVGQLDADRADGLRVAPVDDRALVPADGADPVAGTEERVVARDDDVEQRGQVALGLPLRLRLGLLRVRRRERAAAEDDPCPVVEVDRRQRRGPELDPVELVGGDAEEPGERGVLVERRPLLRPDGEEQERPGVARHQSSGDSSAASADRGPV